MSEKVYVELAELFVKGQDHNAIQCGVSYSKRYGQVELSLDAVFVKHEDKWDSVGFAPFSSPGEKIVLEDGWARDNKKKVEALRVKTFGAIKNRTGSAWEHVVAFADKHGMKIKEAATS